MSFGNPQIISSAGTMNVQAEPVPTTPGPRQPTGPTLAPSAIWLLNNVRNASFAGGAAGDGITDDTAAFIAAQAGNAGVYVPPGVYNFNPTGLTPIVSGSDPTFVGDDTATTIIMVGNNGYFVDTSVGWTSAYVRGITFSGTTPAGFFRSTFTGVNVNNPKVWDYCNFQNHQVAAVSSNGTDEPWFKFLNCRFRTSNVTTAFDVALAGFADSCEFLSCSFTGARVNLKFRSACTAKITDCDFIPNFAQSGGTIRARVWFVPNSSNTGGPTIKGSKFGNEGIGAGDWHIIICGELAGTWVGDMQPDLATAQANFMQNITIDEGCVFNGSGGGSQNPPPIYTLTQDLRGLAIKCSFAGTRPAYIVQFATPPTTSPATGLVNDTWRLGPFVFQDVASIPAPLYTNAVALIGRPLDAGTSETDPVAPLEGPGDPYDFHNIGIGAVTAWSTTNATVTGIADMGGGTNAATIAATAANGLAFFSGGVGVIGKPMWVEFDLEQGGASPVSTVLLVVRQNVGNVYYSRTLTVPSGWHRYSISIPGVLNASNVTILLQIATNGGTVNIGRVIIYQARQRVQAEAGWPVAVTAGAATAGAVVPTNFVGFLQITVNGAKVKIPYYNV